MKDVPRNLKQYFLGWLVKGERWNDTEGAEAAALMPLQLAFLRAQMEARTYIVAGPVMEDEHVGFMIIDAKSAEEALRLANADPAVKAGRLAVEVQAAFLPSLDGVRVEY
jgi:uncharacterized protein YciI